MKTARWTIGALVAGVALAASTTPAFAKTHKVLPGESIQAAITAALPGDKVLVYPGTYQEMNNTVAALTIDKPLFLQGKPNKKLGEAGKVVLIPYGTQQDGIRAEGGGPSDLIDGVRIQGFSVQGFPNNGIHLRYTTNFRIEKNEPVNNLENGIFPTLSANGLVKRNVSYGSEDSALWVEASTNVRVLQNELHHSPTGLEVTVSQEISMEKNDIHDNTTGVGLYHANGSGLGLQPFENKNWYLRKNHIYNNNEPNTAPGGQAAALPPGGGVLVLGVDKVRIEDNLIENNHFYGVSVIDYCTAVEGSDRDCDLIPPIEDEFPDYDYIGDNDAIGNGTDPAKFCSNDGSQLCELDADCGLGNTCDPHPLAAYAADYTYLVIDLLHVGEKHGNKICGYGSSTFGTDPLSNPFNKLPKC